MSDVAAPPTDTRSFIRLRLAEHQRDGLLGLERAHGDRMTQGDPDKRIDWVFGRGVSFADVRVLSDALSSDHLPLAMSFAATADQGS